MWRIDRTLSSGTSPGLNLGVMAMKRYPAFTTAPKLLKPIYYVMSFSRDSSGESYQSAEMQSVYSATPSEWATGHSLGKPYPSEEMLSVYSATPPEWATGHWMGKSYTSEEMQIVYSVTPSEWATGHPLGKSDYHWRDADGVFSKRITSYSQVTWPCVNYRPPPQKKMKKEEETCHLLDFAFLADNSKKIDQYLCLARKMKFLWTIRVKVIATIFGALVIVVGGWRSDWNNWKSVKESTPSRLHHCQYRPESSEEFSRPDETFYYSASAESPPAYARMKNLVGMKW